MLRHIEFPEQEFAPVPLSFDSASEPSISPKSAQVPGQSSRPNHTIIRRMQRLKGYCLPLDYDVPPAVKPDNILKRMGDAQAAKLIRRHKRKKNKELC